eukprot:356174-Chlamydomonas_euryale.AAC.11
MPDEPVVKQLLFAEGLVELGGMVGRPRSIWRDRAMAALHPVLTSRLAGWGWYGVAQDYAQWCVPFVTAPYPLLDPLCLATLNTCIPFGHVTNRLTTWRCVKTGHAAVMARKVSGTTKSSFNWTVADRSCNGQEDGAGVLLDQSVQ